MTGRIRVLVADDHPIVREGLAAVLDQEEDLEVVGEAANGVDAFSIARERRPDIVLMDLQMPEMNGVEAITKIKEELPGIEVIILTTFDTDEYIFSGIEAGAQAYLLKDSPPDEVLRAIRAVHRGESLIQPRVTRKLLERFTELAHASLSPEQVPEAPLSLRELEVLELIARGRSNKSIAGDLVIGESTVKTHIIHIFNKLGVKDRTEAVTEAIRHGIIQL